MAQNIEINYYNGEEYQILYPLTLGELVSGKVSDSDKLNGYTYSQVISNSNSQANMRVRTGSYTGTGTSYGTKTGDMGWDGQSNTISINLGINAQIFICLSPSFSTTIPSSQNNGSISYDYHFKYGTIAINTANFYENGTFSIKLSATSGSTNTTFNFTRYVKVSNVFQHYLTYRAGNSISISQDIWGIGNTGLGLDITNSTYKWMAVG